MKSKTVTISPKKRLPEVQDMLYKLAWNTAKKTPIPFDDCLSEAYWLYMKACGMYQPERGKFSSWVYFVVHNNLKTMVTKRCQDPLRFVEHKDRIFGAAPDAIEKQTVELWNERLGGISQEAQEILHLLFETPVEIMEEAGLTPKRLLRRVKEYLIVCRGRPKPQVEAAHIELCERLQAAWV